MPEPLRYEVDGATYLERQNRAAAQLAILEGREPFDPTEWANGFAAICREVDELPLVIGVRYRIRLLGGIPTNAHHRYQDGAGAVHAVDFPVVREPEYLEFEGTYTGRVRTNFGTSSILLDVDDKTAVIADIDVLRLEEIR